MSYDDEGPAPDDVKVACRWEEDRHCRLVRREGWIVRFLGNPVLNGVLAWSGVAFSLYLLISLWPVLRSVR